MRTTVISVLEINQIRNLSITQLGLNQRVFSHCVRRMQLWFHWSQWNCIYWIMPYSQTVNIWYAKESDIRGIKDLRKSIIYVFGIFGLEKNSPTFQFRNEHTFPVSHCLFLGQEQNLENHIIEIECWDIKNTWARSQNDELQYYRNLWKCKNKYRIAVQVSC